MTFLGLALALATWVSAGAAAVKSTWPDLDRPIDELDLSKPKIAALIGEDVRTIAELSVWTEFELMRLPSMGRKIVNSMSEALRSRGGYFGMTPFPRLSPHGRVLLRRAQIETAALASMREDLVNGLGLDAPDRAILHEYYVRREPSPYDLRSAVADLPFTTETARVLAEAGILTLAEAARRTEGETWSLPGMTREVFWEVREALLGIGEDFSSPGSVELRLARISRTLVALGPERLAEHPSLVAEIAAMCEAAVAELPRSEKRLPSGS